MWTRFRTNPNVVIARQQEYLKPSPYPLFLRTQFRRTSFALFSVFMAGLLAFDGYAAYALATVPPTAFNLGNLYNFRILATSNEKTIVK